MNVIDLIVIGIIVLCVLYGFYRGFIQSVLNLGSCLASFALSFALFPRIADAISGNTDLVRLISSYTDSESLLGDLDLSSQAVANLGSVNVAAIAERADLPASISTILQHNLEQKVFSPMGPLATSVGDYVNQTILSVSINVLSFLVCFVVCFVVLKIIVNMLRAVFRFPLLKQLDWLAGGVFGFGVGVLLCFVAFTLLPLLESVIPIPEFRALVSASTLAPLFENSTLIISIMNRKLL